MEADQIEVYSVKLPYVALVFSSNYSCQPVCLRNQQLQLNSLSFFRVYAGLCGFILEYHYEKSEVIIGLL